MSDKPNNPSQRYVNDLNRYNYISGKSQQIRGQMLPFALALVFLVVAGVFGNFNLHVAPKNILLPRCCEVTNIIAIRSSRTANGIAPILCIMDRLMYHR